MLERFGPDTPRRWIWRFAVAGAVIAVVLVAMSAAGAGPRVLPFVAIALAVTAILSAAYDLGAAVAGQPWPLPLARVEPPGNDPRVLKLARLIDGATIGDGRSTALRDLLAEAAAARVAARHGVTRLDDPARFERIVGTDLITWFDAADHDADRDPAPTTRRQLAAIVRRIEAL